MSNVLNLHANAGRNLPVIAILPLLYRPVRVNGGTALRVELRNQRAGKSAAEASRAAGGSPTDNALAAFTQMSGLTVHQTLAMDTRDLERCLTIAISLTELA